MKPASASCGLTFNCAEDLTAKLRVMTLAGYDFLVTPIVHPRYRLPEEIEQPSSMVIGSGDSLTEKSIKRGYAFTRSDLMLDSGDWSSLIVGMISRDLNLESNCQSIRRIAEERLKRELNFSIHLGLAAIMIPLNKPNNLNLSRIIYTYLMRGGNGQVWVRVPFNNQQESSAVDVTQSAVSEVINNTDFTIPPPNGKELNKSLKNSDEGQKRQLGEEKASIACKNSVSDTWEWWDVFRGCANTEKRLFLALSLDKGIPDEDRLERWLGEPVKALIISTRLFLTNKRGCPVLPRSVQAIIKRFIPLKVQYIIEGRHLGHDMQLYQQYMDHLVDQFYKETCPDALKNFATGYEDFLQSPLQPLMDNLESSTYEVFEKDPIKYSEYQRAIQLALQERITDEEAKRGHVLILMVLGAGRGPLVRASLKAAELSGRQIKVYAVEKNPNAVVTLLSQKDEVWGEQVDVISGDMREWKPKVKADIVISELLGSFGDNELSPECLYDAERLLKPDAISIPTQYTSWVGPIQSSKLYHEVRASVDIDKNPNAPFETPYVVHFQNRTELAKPQPLFTFDHPSYGANIDVTRYEVKSFEIKMDSELHGFAGYFECVLYKDVMISILPETHSKGMFSWFPIFFPLKAPVKLRKNDPLELHFWRLNNKKHVWYEWCISKPVPMPIHNPNGRSYEIGL